MTRVQKMQTGLMLTTLAVVSLGSALTACGPAIDSCEADCPAHSSCVDGQCVCDDGFAGDDCAAVQQDLVLSDFEDVSLDSESFYNGSDGAGGFGSGELFYQTNYNSDYQSWDGFAASNVTDTTTAGWGNQYGVIAGQGQGGSSNFAVAYVSTMPGATPPQLHFKDDQAGPIAGAYFCNSTQAFLSMRDGDDYAKKFGGDDGTDPDWFKLDIYGLDATGQRSGPVEFYLADYRADDSADDYLVGDWTWVDLSSLGEVSGLAFALSSTDVGDYGMNTPAYFAVDTVMAQRVE